MKVFTLEYCIINLWIKIVNTIAAFSDILHFYPIISGCEVAKYNNYKWPSGLLAHWDKENCSPGLAIWKEKRRSKRFSILKKMFIHITSVCLNPICLNLHSPCLYLYPATYTHTHIWIKALHVGNLFLKCLLDIQVGIVKA